MTRAGHQRPAQALELYAQRLLFKRAVRSKENGRNIDSRPNRADVRDRAITPILPANRRVGTLRQDRPAADNPPQGLDHADFRTAVVANPRLRRCHRGNKPGNQGQQG